MQLQLLSVLLNLISIAVTAPWFVATSHDRSHFPLGFSRVLRKYSYRLRWPDLRKSIRRFDDPREASQGSRFGTEAPFCEARFGALKLANRRFEATRANRSKIS